MLPHKNRTMTATTTAATAFPAAPAAPAPEAQPEEFAALGLFDELHDADCVELFADVFRDAANLEIGDQVLLEALGQDWWDDEPPASAPAPVPAPVAAAQPAPAAATYKSLAAQIAVVAPCFSVPADAMPSLVTMPAMPAVAGLGAEVDVRTLDTRARRQIAIARWKEKRKRRNFGERHRFPEYDCRRKVANRRPRVNGRFIREQPIYMSIAELQAIHQL